MSKAAKKKAMPRSRAAKPRVIKRSSANHRSTRKDRSEVLKLLDEAEAFFDQSISLRAKSRESLAKARRSLAG